MTDKATFKTTTKKKKNRDTQYLMSKKKWFTNLIDPGSNLAGDNHTRSRTMLKSDYSNAQLELPMVNMDKHTLKFINKQPQTFNIYSEQGCQTMKHAVSKSRLKSEMSASQKDGKSVKETHNTLLSPTNVEKYADILFEHPQSQPELGQNQ